MLQRFEAVFASVPAQLEAAARCLDEPAAVLVDDDPARLQSAGDTMDASDVATLERVNRNVA